MKQRKRIKQIAPGVMLVHESELSSYLRASEEALTKLYKEKHGKTPTPQELNVFANELQENTGEDK